MKTVFKTFTTLFLILSLFASFSACNTDDAKSNETTAQSTQQPEHGAPDEIVPDYSPSSIGKLIDTADDFVVNSYSTVGEESTYVYEKDGAKVKETFTLTIPSECYYDFGEKIYYKGTDDNGTWLYVEDPDMTVRNVMVSALLHEPEFIFNDDNYNKYDADADRYVMNRRALNENYAPAEGNASGYLAREGDTYVFNITETVDGEEWISECRIEFKDTTVTLPENAIPEPEVETTLWYEDTATDLRFSFTLPNQYLSIEDAEHCAVSGCVECRKSTVVIPDTMWDVPVTAINQNAFGICAHIQKITLPDSIVSIGRWAFEDCTGLTEITIPAAVMNIDEWAFSGCDALTSVTFENPNGWTVDGEPVDLSDPAQAARYLTDTYCDAVWTRS